MPRSATELESLWDYWETEWLSRNSQYVELFWSGTTREMLLALAAREYAGHELTKLAWEYSHLAAPTRPTDAEIFDAVYREIVRRW